MSLLPDCLPIPPGRSKNFHAPERNSGSPHQPLPPAQLQPPYPGSSKYPAQSAVAIASAASPVRSTPEKPLHPFPAWVASPTKPQFPRSIFPGCALPGRCAVESAVEGTSDLSTRLDYSREFLSIGAMLLAVKTG